MSSRWKGSLFLFLGFALAGSSVISARILAERLGTFTITLVSLSFAIILLALVTRKRLIDALHSININDFLMILLQALFGIFLFRLFLLKGLLHTSTTEAGILTGATPAITTLLAILFLKERPSFAGFIGIASTVSGILLLQSINLSGVGFPMEHLIGNLLVLCAAFSESLFNIFSRSFAKKINIDKSPMDADVQTTLVVILSFLLCILPAAFESPISSLSSIGIKEWAALLWYGTFVTAIAFILWYSGIKRSSAVSAAAFSGMMPLTSLILSVSILNEEATPLQWTGGFLIISGMAFIRKRS